MKAALEVVAEASRYVVTAFLAETPPAKLTVHNYGLLCLSYGYLSFWATWLSMLRGPSLEGLNLKAPVLSSGSLDHISPL